jgi:hypothetical protein
MFAAKSFERTHAEFIALVVVANNAVQEMGSKNSCITKLHLDEDLETVRGQLKCLHIGVFEILSKPASNS